jgi:hypothetical protein
MTNQYCRPFLLARAGAKEVAQGLARVGYERDSDETFSESYLRDLLFTHPAEFLQAHAHLNFSFALVELAVYSLPDELGGGRLVQPRVVCRTCGV